MSTKNAKNTCKIDERILLKTGEFSKLANINRDTLTFYIKKKLITPAYIGENKYKYFAPEQVQTITLIKYLRRCLMPIEMIRDILSNPSCEHLRRYAAEQKKYLEEKMYLLKEASSFIEDYRKEKEFLDSQEPEIPFIQYCEKQLVNVFPVRFCQPFQMIPDLQNLADYLNELSFHMVYNPSVCVIPSDTRNCDEFCSLAGKKPLFNTDFCGSTTCSQYTRTLDEGLYAMIIGKSRTEKMDANLSLLREKIDSSGYQPDDQLLYLFVETSLLRVPQSSGQRYMMKMKVRKKEKKPETGS